MVSQGWLNVNQALQGGLVSLQVVTCRRGPHIAISEYLGSPGHKGGMSFVWCCLPFRRGEPRDITRSVVADENEGYGERCIWFMGTIVGECLTKHSHDLFVPIENDSGVRSDWVDVIHRRRP